MQLSKATQNSCYSLRTSVKTGKEKSVQKQEKFYLKIFECKFQILDTFTLIKILNMSKFLILLNLSHR